MLVPTTKDPMGEVNSHVEAAWDTFETGGYEAFPIGPDEAKIMRIGMSTNAFFTPDVEPKKQKSLVCLLLELVLGDEEDPHIFLGPGCRLNVPQSPTLALWASLLIL
jgi:hypothetical protein